MVTAQASTAQFQLSPPEKFTFESSAEWPKWRRRWDRFRIASGLVNKSDAEQINTLVYCMGDEADEILASFKLPESQLKEYATVIEKFQNHFVIRHNTVYERAVFNARKQMEGETTDAYVTALHSLAKYCEFGDLQEDLIRDQLVIGLLDTKLSQRLQLDAELTLTKAVDRARQTEQVKKQQTELQTQKDAHVEAISKFGKRRQKGKENHKPPDHQLKKPVNYWKNGNAQKTHQAVDKPEGATCQWCARERHDRSHCPAKASVCNRCKKKGHWGRACRMTSGVSEISDQDIFLGEVSDAQVNNPWWITVEVRRHALRMKIDTGADVTVIPFEWYKFHLKDMVLHPSARILRGPGEATLDVAGELRCVRVQYKHKFTQQTFFVVKNISVPLLGRPAIEGLNLLSRVDGLNTTPSSLNPQVEYPQLFEGLGSLQQPYEIRLNKDANPYALAVPRRVPVPLMKTVREELERMSREGIIEAVDSPTEWCAPMVVVPKKDNSVRICVDYTELNRYVLRERYQMPSVEHTLAQVTGATVFSKLDANSGFWQVPLTEESSILTTFITPFGRFRFNRLPFGITSAPEVFQKRIENILTGTEGRVNLTDDILIWGIDQEEHDCRAREILGKLRDAKVTLNPNKCIFSAKSIKFLGHEISSEGVRPDKEKTQAIQAFKRPQCVEDVKRFLGMVNFLAKFVSNLASMARPLSELLSQKVLWHWDGVQESAFRQIKQQLASEPVLALFDLNKETVVSSDASSFALGAVLLQNHGGEMKPVAYASRTLTSTEGRYAQIEKEALALTWACMRFQNFLTGLNFEIQTDHKPLVTMFTKTPIDDLSPRIQRFRIRMMRYNFVISYVPGKELVVADALSRAPAENEKTQTDEDSELGEEVEAYIQSVITTLPATDMRLEEISREQRLDRECSAVIKFVQDGWPKTNKMLSPEVMLYWRYRHQLTVVNELLMMGKRLVIPKSLRKEMMKRVHEGHMGIARCRERAKQSVWWPRISTEIKDTVERCEACVSCRVNSREPLITSPTPSRPWEVVALDLFCLKGKSYLLVTDYFSRFPEVALLNSLTAEAVINHLKGIFARHGIPALVRSDNGPQFRILHTSAFSAFAKEYGFRHATSSPLYPQSNGMIEAAVKTVKLRLKKSQDPYLALLAYRTTPLENGFCPSQLLMGRIIRSSLPVADQQLQPKWPNFSEVRKKETKQKQRQSCDYDRRHNVHHLRPLDVGEEVWVKDASCKGKVVERANAPRSYWIQTAKSLVRRNRLHLVPTQVNCKDDEPEEADDDETSPPEESLPTTGPLQTPAGVTMTRSGRIVKKPDRLNL